MFGMEPHPLLDKIRSLEPTEMTPMNALEMLHQWQQELTEPSDAEASDVKKNASSNSVLAKAAALLSAMRHWSEVCRGASSRSRSKTPK